MSEAYDPITTALTGQLAFVVIASSLLAFLLSLACLAVYKRAVSKAMLRRAFASDVHRATTAHHRFSWHPHARHSQHQHFEWDRSKRVTLQQALPYSIKRGVDLGSRTRLRNRRILFSAVMSLAFFRSSKIEPNWVSFSALTVLYLWPAALTTIIVAAQTRRTKLAILALYFLLFTLINAIAISSSPTLRIDHIIFYWGGL